VVAAVAAAAVGVAWLAVTPFLLGVFTGSSPAADEQSAHGTVVKVVWSEGVATYGANGELQKSSGGPACAAIVEAKVDGQRYQKQETSFSAPCTVKVGDARDVYFTPDNAAASLHVAPARPRTAVQILVPAAGVLPLAAAGILLVRRRKLAL
jgi:hypothetical protein